jgi:hypothetical protein
MAGTAFGEPHSRRESPKKSMRYAASRPNGAVADLARPDVRDLPRTSLSKLPRVIGPRPVPYRTCWINELRQATIEAECRCTKCAAKSLKTGRSRELALRMSAKMSRAGQSMCLVLEYGQ